MKNKLNFYNMTDIQVLVKELSAKYGIERSSLMPILQGIVSKERYLSSEAMTEVARELDISAAEVYGTATFYSFLDTNPRGKFVIRVCRTIVCDMHGKQDVLKTLESFLKIKVGETTMDKKFSLLETNCIGWCNEGPAMLINDEVFTKLTVDKTREIIQDYIRNK
jgi:NADH-quinone oxidoreductase subunit E